MDFCQTEWMFLDLTILASFLHFYYCMHFWTYLNSQIYGRDCFASNSLRLTLSQYHWGGCTMFKKKKKKKITVFLLIITNNNDDDWIKSYSSSQ